MHEKDLLKTQSMETPKVSALATADNALTSSATTAESPQSKWHELPPRPANTRFLSFDIWRGIACLMLLFFHATFYADRSWGDSDKSWGALGVRLSDYLWVGVPMFFVVSGYCIAASIDSKRRKPHSIGDYFLRRIRRIYPPLWAALALAICFSIVVSQNAAILTHCKQIPHLGEFTTWQWVGNFLAIESWLPLFSGAWEKIYVMPNTWTLCYEEQFYAMAGLMLLLASRRYFSAALVVTVLTLAIRHLCRANDVKIVGFFFDGHWLLFAAGLFAYHYLHYASTKLKLLTVAGLVAGMVYALLDRRGQTEYVHRHLDDYIFTACGFAIALIVMWRWDKSISQWRWLRPIAWCGKISYSIYLTHYPIVVVIASLFAMFGVHDDASVLLVVLPTCLIVSLPVAWLFYQGVERRFLNAAAPKTSGSRLRLALPMSVRWTRMGSSAGATSVDPIRPDMVRETSAG